MNLRRLVTFLCILHIHTGLVLGEQPIYDLAVFQANRP